jgi:hypothetical protein
LAIMESYMKSMESSAVSVALDVSTVSIFWRTTGLYGGNLSVVWLMLLLVPMSMGATVLSHFKIAVADPDLLTKRQEKSQWEESHCGVRNEEVYNLKRTYRVTCGVFSLFELYMKSVESSAVSVALDVSTVSIFWRTTGLYGGNLSVVWLMLLLAPMSMGATVLSHFEIVVADPDLLTYRQEKSQWEESHCGIRNEDVHNLKRTYQVTRGVFSLFESYMKSVELSAESVALDVSTVPIFWRTTEL